MGPIFKQEGIYMPDIKALKETMDSEQAERERIKGNKAARPAQNSTPFDPSKYAGVPKNNDIAVRILGEPFDSADRKPTDHKLVMVSRILKDSGDGFLTTYWPAEKKEFKWVPKKDFILTKLYDAVMKDQWVQWKEEDMQHNPTLVKDEKGVIRNAKGHNGRYIPVNEGTASYARIKSNAISGSTSKYSKPFYPSARILMNVIDRSDDWCATHKNCRILCSKKEFNAELDRTFVESGIGTTVYEKIVDTVARGIGDWEKTDLVIQKLFTGKEFKDYAVWDATDTKFFINPETVKTVSTKELTKEEQAYSRHDFDKMYNPNYRLIQTYLGTLFKLVDGELGTSFVEELQELVIKESEKTTDHVHSSEGEE